MLKLIFRLSHFCGTIAEPTTSVTNEVQIRFFAQGALFKQNNKPPKLEVLYTAFREVMDPSKYLVMFPLNRNLLPVYLVFMISIHCHIQ